MFNDIIATPNEDLEEEDDVSRDAEARNSILATWHISLANILEVRKTAADLLSLMSFFDRQTIPEDLLKPHRNQEATKENTLPRPSLNPKTGRTLALDHIKSPQKASSVADARAFDGDITLLIDYSFISVTTDKQVFEMHRLVQRATQRWLRDHEGQLSHWQGRFVNIMHDAFPKNWNAMSGNADVCHNLMPQASLALSLQLVHPTRKTRLQQAELEHCCALHMFERGTYVESGRLAAHSLEVFEKLLGPRKQDIGRAMKLLVRVKRQQRKFGEAEPLQSRICDRKQAAHGDEHPDTLMAMSHLVWLYLKQRRLEEAKALQMQILTLMQKVLPDTDGRVLFSMDRLAAIYVDLGQLSSAERLQTSYCALTPLNTAEATAIPSQS